MSNKNSLNSFVLENQKLKMQFNVKDSKINSFELYNKIADEHIVCENGSEVFVINFKSFLFKKAVSSRELKIKKIDSSEQQGKSVTRVCFSPATVKNKALDIVLVLELENDAHYLKSHLELSSAEKDFNVILDYIDFAPIKIGINQTASSLPKQDSSHISGTVLSLGQPVFWESTFLGCEFPVTENKIENGTICVKYYSGKTVSELLKNKEKYVSYNFVIGVSQSQNETSLRLALFDYIEKIAKPLKFRVQYNSWYDHMLNISTENIEQSFYEIEKGMAKVGTDAFDCYVVDDGWNDYKKGFWGFNNKFPNEFYPASALTKALGSSFGMWLGPRGGYTSDTIKFAKQIEKAGNGFVNKRSNDIDVGSEKYIKKVSDLMVDFEKRFDIQYWKLDGFAQNSCRDKKHDHIVGGKDDLYYYSELWEKWLGVFDRLEKESSNGIFINLTCYAPPSPWMLRWVNCMWMQVSDDHGYLKINKKSKNSESKKDQMLTYRDNRYHDFLRQRRFVFPQSRIYNHDPIYANEIKFEMTDDEFCDYLFAMAARGTSFWELYYSYNLMNEEKWRINNRVLSFIRENLNSLKNCVMIGGVPGEGQVYGYSSFADKDGIVMLRNPSANEQSYVLHFDEKIGTSKNLSNAKSVLVYPYSNAGVQSAVSYGDKITLTLAPFQTKIFSFGKVLPELKVEYIKAISSNIAEVMFNQTVVIDKLGCAENKITSAKLLADCRSAVLTFENDFTSDNAVSLNNIQNIYLEDNNCNIKFKYYKDCVIGDKVIIGKDDFSIVVTTGGEEVKDYFKQGSEILLCKNGNKIEFTVGETTISSVSLTADVVQICAVRERNGVIKLYLNKKLDCGSKEKNGKTDLKGQEVTCFDFDKVKVYNKAFGYNEV